MQCRVKDGAFCFPGIATGWGGLLGSGGFSLAAAYACEVVLPPALVTDGAISREVMSYFGWGALAMALLVAIGAGLIFSPSLWHLISSCLARRYWLCAASTPWLCDRRPADRLPASFASIN